MKKGIEYEIEQDEIRMAIAEEQIKQNKENNLTINYKL